MNFKKRLLIASIIIFAAANLIIFTNRNRGFEYQKFSRLTELYPDNSDNSFSQKWTNANQQFKAPELNMAMQLLKQKTGIDTISNKEDKVLRIAAWMYKSFYQQLGKPSDSVSKQSPFQQYLYLTTHKRDQLWCGNFQRMFGFFCTAAQLPNRYVEVMPANDHISADYHEVNEVYLSEMKKWMMVDITRNVLSILGNKEPISAATYFDLMLRKQNDSLFITRLDTISFRTETLLMRESSEDNYFNENHILRYYHTIDLSETYTTISKIKRYIFTDPWYEMYDPLRRHSNILFRIKQFFIFGLLACALLLFFEIKIKGRKKRFSPKLKS